MKVLLLGAGGNLGLRLIPALLTHSHTLVAYVRSPAKLHSLLLPTVYEQITIVQGDSTDSQAVKSAILDHKCDAVINTSGRSAVAPWSSSDFPKLFRAVVEAVREAGEEREEAVRFWALGGVGVLRFPGTEVPLSFYIPVFLEHQQNLALLRSLPPDAVDWSMLCPSAMSPESSDFSVPAKPPRNVLVAGADSPPQWKTSWFQHIPVIGRVLASVVNAGRYGITLEQAAEFVAGDLEEGGREWVGRAVGIISVAL